MQTGPGFDSRSVRCTFSTLVTHTYVPGMTRDTPWPPHNTFVFYFTGNVTNTGHHIPHGDMFEYVSCPHFSMEIFIYIAISTMVGWQHQVCMSLCLFVFTNQLIQGYLVDKWYRETFPKYPSRRKAVLPFIFWCNTTANACVHTIGSQDCE